MMADDTFLTTAEVLEYLHVNLRTVYRLLKAGRIPAVRVGRQWRFRRSDLDAWLDAQRPGRARPPAEPAPAGPSAVAAPRAAGRRPRVLVVDDEPEVRSVLAKMLEVGEYEVDEAENGEAAIHHLRQQPVDLLVTDLRMPGLDGLAVVREARRILPRLAVVIVTGFSSEEAAIAAINLGVNGYLTKPFRAAKVLAVVAQALGE